ncbi:MAG: S8 family serine peptidase [Anaerolineales bacterium]|nr:S8 family serine peptidase [Anaerolineales bacterium]
MDPWSNSTSPVDFGGHGTHTLGTVLGANVGVAPGVQWIGCTNLQRNLGNPAFYLDCLQFMLAPYPQQGDPFRDGDPLRSANVLNNSWGCPEKNEGCDPQSLQPAVEALRAAGIFVVASAGNEGPLCSSLDSPIAIYDAAFTVGASDINRNLAPFSSAGPVTADGSGRIKPDILAPGVQVPSAYPTNAYTELDGTSMAGPHVAGVVALLWSANPDLIGDIDRTEALMIDTATPFTGTLGGLGPMMQETGEVDPDPVTALLLGSMFSRDACVFKTDLAQTPNVAAGYGIVNAYAAVKQALDR